MDQLSQAQNQITQLLESINQFIETESENAIYKPPIIDYNHNSNSQPYNQSSVIGLKRFLNSVENEQNFIENLIRSQRPPKEISSNLPNLLAIWEQVKYAEWPIISISQLIDCGASSGLSTGSGSREGQIKIDLVENGGQTWVKVNTIKESRLMAEFREQDSYINSDYESESDSSSSGTSTSYAAGPSKPARPRLTNSLIKQATSLVNAAEAYPRLDGFQAPRIKYVLNRLEEDPPCGYPDQRFKETFQAIRDLGVDLILASDERRVPTRPTEKRELIPTKKILLDLSVLVALCCDSTHLELPTSNQDLESRFRNLQLNHQNGELELSDHIPVTKDLRDQLEWEMKHPLIQELLDRLTPICHLEGEVEFWVTDEVKNRLPNIVDLIGGENEKRRANILFNTNTDTDAKTGDNTNNNIDDDDNDFWKGSRWKGKEGILRTIKINVLPPEIDGSGYDSGTVRTAFQKGFVTVTKKMLEIVNLQAERHKQVLNGDIPIEQIEGKKKNNYGDRKRRKAKFQNPNPNAIKGFSFNIDSKLPSEHTLRTFLVGFQKNWTVLTNNRGSVGKVLRELKIDEGLGYPDTRESDESDQGRDGVRTEEGEEEEEEEGGYEKVDIWIVNPSSLSEWRRKQVEYNNSKLLEYLKQNPDKDNRKSYEDWLDENSQESDGQEGVVVNEQGNGLISKRNSTHGIERVTTRDEPIEQV